ncbi:hypothetical protein ACWFRJ_30850 [Streptomyces sp. NPDC055239]
MISAKDIPHFTGDLEQLEQHASGLRAHAGALRQAGSVAHTKFQGLGAFYRAPEAEELFASTAPVRDRADLFASKVETVAGALDDYAGAVRPIIARLDRLRTRVADFVAGLKTDSGEIDDEWTQDQDKIDQHEALWSEVGQAKADFTAAEIAANNKITALVGGTQYVPQGYEGTLVPRGAQVYGYTADALKHADKLPWGTPEALTYDKFDLSHHVREAGVSIKDNVVGTVTGFVDLFSPGADGDAARKGLGMAVLGLESYLFDPLNEQDSPWKEQVAEGRPYTKAFAKGLVGWDDWEDHPGKATGTVFFNGLTIASGPLAAVSKLAKGGAVAKTAGTLAKVGEAIDPLSATARAVGATTRAVPKIADVTARARAGFGNAPGTGSVSTVWRFAPGSELHVGSGDLAVLKGGVRDTTPPRVELSANERIPSIAAPRDHQNAIHRPDEMPNEGTAAERANAGAEALPRRGPLLVGVHAGDDATAALRRDGDVPPRSSPLQGPETASHTGDGVGGAAGRAGDDIGGVGRDVSGGTASHFPPGTSGGFTHGPSASHELPGSGGHTASPGSGDHLPGNHIDHDPARAGDQTISGREGAGAGSEGSGVPPTGGRDVPGAVTAPEHPRGNRPDGSWEGESGLRLSPGDNATADDFMRHSAEAEPRITDTLQQITHNVDDGRLIGLDYRLKGEDSLKRKLATQLIDEPERTAQSALGKVRDSIRYTVEFPSSHYAPGVQQAVDTLRAQGFESVTFKNTWDSPGYKGINSTWRDPATGRIFEVQFHTPESFVAKMDTHVLYEKGRLPGVTREELDAINAQQDELFDQVPVPRETGTIGLTHDVRPGHSATAGTSATGSHHGPGEVRSNAPPGAGGAVRDEHTPHHDGGQSHTAGSTDSQVNHDPDVTHGGTDASDGMGTRRDYEARVSPESTIAVPPKEASDLVLETGDHVYFGDGATAIGYDQNTVGNFARVKPLEGYHDVVVHGNNRGFFMPGRINEAGVGFPAGDVHPSHIADAIRNNPSYNGGPIRLVSCHTGYVRFMSDEIAPPIGEGVLHDSAAQAIANELGVPVMAPTDAVGTFSNRGPGQIPRINRMGYWRTFLPMSQ